MKFFFSHRQLWFVAFLFTSSLTIAQTDLSISPSSGKFTYIYRLSNERVIDYFAHGRSFIPIDVSESPVDSFLTDSGYRNNLHNGNYVFVWAEETNLNYEFHLIHNFQVKLIDSYRELAVSVSDSAGNAIKNAIVNVKRTPLQFDSTRNFYFLPKTKKDGVLSVQVGDEVECVDVIAENKIPAILRPIRLFYRWLPIDNLFYGIWYGNGIFSGFRKDRFYFSDYDGYIITNKPMYNQGDTVKVKAYLINKKQKPVTKKLVMEVTSWTYSHAPINVTLSPITKGDFVSEFILADTLEIDRDYTIGFHSIHGKKKSVTTEFRLEDYQLDETFYEVKTEKKNFMNSEPVSVTISGHDANGLPLKDARVEVLMMPVMFIQSYLPAQYVADTIVQLTQVLDGDGTTEIVFPDSVFPKAKMNLVLKCFFMNSNNETKDTLIFFSINKPDKMIDVKLEDGTLKASLIQDGKSLKATGMLSAYKELYDLLFSKTVNLPYQEKVNPLIRQYKLKVDGEENLLNVWNEKDQVSSSANRTKDSVFARLTNPFHLAISYEVYEANDLLTKGITDSSFIWKAKDQSATSYFFIYYYLWAGRAQSITDRAILFDRRLNVVVEQKADVYPGEESTSTIRVSDYEGHPVSHVNVTASAVNNQFETYKLPDIPEFSKSRGLLKYYNVYSLGNQENVSRGYNHLSQGWIKRMRLDSSLFYQFKYPSVPMVMMEEKISAGNAQFSAYLYHNGLSSPVVMIYVDAELMYYFDTDANSRYSIIVKPGYHQVRIISMQAEYSIDSVLFKTGVKLEMVIDPQTVRGDSRIAVADRRAKLSDREINDLRQSLLYFRTAKEYYDIFVRVRNRIYKIDQKNYYHSGLLCAGPFNQSDQLTLIIPNEFQRTFFFKPGYDYLLDTFLVSRDQMPESGIVHKTFDWRIRNQNLPFGQVAFTDSDLIVPPGIFYPSPFSGKQPEKNSGDNGSLRLVNATDSAFYALILMPSLLPSAYLLDAERKVYYDLLPGFYSVKLFTSSGNFIQLDSILIKSRQSLWITIHDQKFFMRDTSSYEYKSIFMHEPINSGSNKLPLIRRYKFGSASLEGKVLDEKTKEGIPFAIVEVMEKNDIVATAQTDENGNYKIIDIAEGTFEIRIVYLGYQSIFLQEVKLQAGKTTQQDILLSQSNLQLAEVIVTGEKLMEVNKTSTGSSYRRSAPMSFEYQQQYQSLSGAFHSRPSYAYDSARISGNDDFLMDIMAGNNDMILSESVKEVRRSYSPDFDRADLDFNAFRGNTMLGFFDPSPAEEQSAIREKFSDYAYWQPNLFTDDSGEVSFKAKFPDNITQWNSYAIAMSEKKMSGAGFTTTHAWKKLVATLSSPRFLVVGDSSEVVGKILNYTGKRIPVSTSFDVNGNQQASNDTSVNEILIEKLPVHAAAVDSLPVTYSLHYEKYFDGEKENIPVIQQGIQKSVGNFYALLHDTSFTFIPADPKIPISFTAHATLSSVFKDDLEHLKQYEYDCNEQLSSKLIADVLLNQINSPDAKKGLSPFARRIKSKLAKNQRRDGSWGWWDNSDGNVWMTCYVLHALHVAGGPSPQYPPTYKAMHFLKNALPSLRSNDLLDALQSLYEWNVKIDFATYINLVKIDSTNQYAEYKLTLLKKETGEKVSADDVLIKRHETIFGNSYWGKEDNTWYDNSIQLSLLAYKILELDSSGKNYLPSICNYFLEQKGSTGFWRNTFESAQILETIIPQVINEKSNYSSPVKLRINEHEEVISDNSFSKKKIAPASAYQIEKEGAAPLYVSCSQQILEPRPKEKDDYFSIKTSFITNEGTSDTLIAGKYATLHVNVQVLKKSDYVMITIPIPAGCSYANKTIPTWHETHRQYFKDKVVIFCESLPEGNYSFDINLEPRFKGTYTINPTQAQLMYFPVLDGNNAGRKVKIY